MHPSQSPRLLSFNILSIMAVLNLRPHRLAWEVRSQGRYLENGNYVEGVAEWEGDLACSAVPNGRADERVFADGKARHYDYTITLDADVRDFRLGERVRLIVIGGAEVVARVQGFQRYQMMCKLWVQSV